LYPPYGEGEMSILTGFRVRIVILLTIVSCISTFILPSPGFCDNWVFVGKNDRYSFYYNNSTININRELKQIEVLVKYLYTEEGREYVINQLKINNINIPNIHKFYYSLNLCYYDYVNMKYKIVSSMNYSKLNEELGGFNNPQMEWRNIPPESVSDSVFNKILNDYHIKK
jgi:hypothetical protein